MRYSRPIPSSSASLRRGVSILEFLCAAVLLTAILAVLFPLLVRLAAAREGIREREAAVRELGNLLEIAGSDGQITRAELDTAGAALVKERLTALEGASFSTRPGDAAAENPLGRMRPVVLSMAWSSGKNQPQTVELTCWLPIEEATP